jgi:hypothetical protein
MGWARLWAIFSQAHLVTLVVKTYVHKIRYFDFGWPHRTIFGHSRLKQELPDNFARVEWSKKL